MPDSATEILISAATALVERAAFRDTAVGTKSMVKAVSLFNELRGDDMSERQGWEFMLCVKLARSSEGEFCIDDFVDTAGYAALAGEAAACELVVTDTVTDFDGALTLLHAGLKPARIAWRGTGCFLADSDGLVVIRCPCNPELQAGPTDSDMGAEDWELVPS